MFNPKTQKYIHADDVIADINILCNKLAEFNETCFFVSVNHGENPFLRELGSEGGKEYLKTNLHISTNFFKHFYGKTEETSPNKDEEVKTKDSNTEQNIDTPPDVNQDQEMVDTEEAYSVQDNDGGDNDVDDDDHYNEPDDSYQDESIEEIEGEVQDDDAAADDDEDTPQDNKVEMTIEEEIKLINKSIRGKRGKAKGTPLKDQQEPTMEATPISSRGRVIKKKVYDSLGFNPQKRKRCSNMDTSLSSPPSDKKRRESGSESESGGKSSKKRGNLVKKSKTEDSSEIVVETLDKNSKVKTFKILPRGKGKENEKNIVVKVVSPEKASKDAPSDTKTPRKTKNTEESNDKKHVMKIKYIPKKDHAAMKTKKCQHCDYTTKFPAVMGRHLRIKHPVAWATKKAKVLRQAREKKEKSAGNSKPKANSNTVNKVFKKVEKKTVKLIKVGQRKCVVKKKQQALEARKKLIERKKYACTQCRAIFCRIESVWRHAETFHPDCNAEEVFTTDFDYSEHLNLSRVLPTPVIIKKDNNYICQTCNKTFSQVVNLKMHIYFEHKGGKFRHRTIPRAGHITYGKFFRERTLRRSSRLSAELAKIKIPGLDDFEEKVEDSKEKLVDEDEAGENDNGTTTSDIIPDETEEEVGNEEGGSTEGEQQGVPSGEDAQDKEGDTRHTCNFCDKTFESAKGLNSHYNMTGHKTKEKSTNFKCYTCNKYYSSLETLKRHMRMTGHQGHDGKSVDEERKMTKHVSKKGVTYYKCSLCKREYTKEKNCIYHMKMKVCLKKFKKNCPCCKERFRSYNLFQAHMAVKHADEYPFKCRECTRTFTNLSSWHHHQESHYRVRSGLEVPAVPQDKTDRPYQCSECKVGFKEKLHWTRHMESKHNDERKYICEICGKRFKRNDNLKDHTKKIHMRIKNDPNSTCHLCGKVLASKKIKQLHIQYIHSDVKPFICDICGYQAKQLSNLRFHIRTHHSDDRPFVCDREGCNAKFKDSQTLKRHLQRHLISDGKIDQAKTYGKLYTCEVCGKSFIGNNTLREHMLSHTNEYPLACHLCGKPMKRRGSLNRHLKTVHSSGKITKVIRPKVLKKPLAKIDEEPGYDSSIESVDDLTIPQHFGESSKQVITLASPTRTSGSEQIVLETIPATVSTSSPVKHVSILGNMLKPKRDYLAEAEQQIAILQHSRDSKQEPDSNVIEETVVDEAHQFIIQGPDNEQHVLIVNAQGEVTNLNQLNQQILLAVAQADNQSMTFQVKSE